MNDHRRSASPPSSPLAASLPLRPQAETKAVIELFTSQGCSSCPPADAMLGEYADRDDVLALSCNVDYWDYLGWKDTLASPDNTERQRDYAPARGDGQVYTPQLVVNGRDARRRQQPGSDRGGAEAADRPACPCRSRCRRSADAITVTIGAAPPDTRLPRARSGW